MSDDIAIRVTGLGKRYKISHETTGYKTLGETITRAVKVPFRRFTGEAPAQSTEDFWALKDVSFEVKKGEALGIIGPNGAGKSTLLKILSRVTMPTQGEIEVHGRIGSLLEVGTGFHPELSGRENVYLSGSILGMKRNEIDAKFNDIVAFAEMEKFLDTPVKRYSSGMYVRLAFAVAAFLEPEILIIDEVLAVGDAGFQKKCIAKMGNLATEGRTVLFVSHNLAIVSDLCTRALLLTGGRLQQNGNPADVILSYLRLLSTDVKGGEIDDDMHKGPTGDFYFRRIALVDDRGEKIAIQPLNAPIRLQIEYEVIRPVRSLRLIGAIFHQDGSLITTFHHTDDCRCKLIDAEPGLYIAEVTLDTPLTAGDYQITLIAKPAPGCWGQGASLDHVDMALRFSVDAIDDDNAFALHNAGRIATRSSWEISRVQI